MTGTGRGAAAVVGCLLILLVGAAPASPAPGPDPAAIDRYLASALDGTGLPGMAVTITRGAEVVHLAGFGTDGRGQPVTAGTPFRIASLSKSFTAAAVHQLVEEGRVELDRPVRTYLPEFTTADPQRSDRITVAHLLHQTSGLADAGFPAITGPQPADLAERVAGLGAARVVSEPGTTYHYFDPNYQVLARLVEVVSEQPFAARMQQRVFAPLGMSASRAAPTAAAAEPLAPGHLLVFDQPVPWPEQDGLLAGSGGVVSTAQDMARWLVMQSTGGAPVLTAASVRAMHTPPAGVASDYAQGWVAVAPEEGPRRIEHDGVLSTYSADQVLLPDLGYGFALLHAGHSQLADTAGVKVGLATLLAGGSPSAPRSTAVLALVLGGLTLAVLARRGWQLGRIGRWRRRRGDRRWWSAVPGIVGLLLPVALLAAVPALVGTFAGRSFTFWQLALALPDVIVLIAVAAVTGTAVAAARVVAIVRRA